MTDTHQFSGSIPANYDKYLGPYLFEPYATDIAKRLQNDECKMLLELACGTGRVTKYLLENLHTTGKMVATDINNDMLTVAKHVVSDERIEWQTADAQSLPFADDTFDHVVCQFGVMFFPDKPKSFMDAYRVLTSGGKYIFNVWGSLEDNRRSGIINEVLAEVFREEAPDFLQKGPYSFYNPDVIKAMLHNAGFVNINVEPVKKEVELADEDDLSKGLLSGTPISTFLQKKDAAVHEEVNYKIKEAMRQEFGDNLTLKMLAYVCTAEKK